MNALIKLFSDHIDALRKVGALKKVYNKSVLQSDRWREVVEK
ncbi:MAG: hypothetical protein ACMUEM_06990 [Flavobacteriales bacterium AspAUS03]